MRAPAEVGRVMDMAALDNLTKAFPAGVISTCPSCAIQGGGSGRAAPGHGGCGRPTASSSPAASSPHIAIAASAAKAEQRMVKAQRSHQRSQ